MNLIALCQKKFTQYILIFSGVIFINPIALAKANDDKPSGPEVITQKSFTQTKDNTINGKVPPGKIGVDTREILLNQTIDGITHSVVRITRLPGYRSPVHYHYYSPVSCVLSGQTSLYTEGNKPKIITAGHCFYMPANVKGANVNTGKTTVTLLDFMTLPKGTPSWVLLEPAPHYVRHQIIRS